MNESIIVAAASGDERAFKAIFDYYVPKMRPVALRYASSAQEAKDILQESFIKILNGLKHYKFEGSFEGWVRRIVINTAIKSYHKHQWEQSLVDIDGLTEDISEEQETEIATESPSRLLELVQQLPDGYRIVMNLYVLEDYSHKEIAEMLQISESTSRSQYSKAKKMLIKMLGRQRKP